MEPISSKVVVITGRSSVVSGTVVGFCVVVVVVVVVVVIGSVKSKVDVATVVVVN